jgi:hypothetical protein
MTAKLRWVLAVGLLSWVSCRKGDGDTTAPTNDGADAGVPDDAVALVDGVAISRDAFDDALVKMVSGGPASRDDKGLRQRVLLALVTRELVRIELAASGKDEGELTRGAVEVEATLGRLARYRDGAATQPAWVAQPPLEQADVARAALLTVQRGAFGVDEAELAAEYERHKQAWTSDQPWVHVVSLAVRYDDATGVPACDDYLEKYRRCSTKFPTSTQPTMLADIDRMSAEWRREAADEAKHAELATKCGALATTTAAETESMACDWTSEVAAGEPGGVKERKKIAKQRAKALRDKLASGVEAAVVAAEVGPEAGGDLVAHAGELARPVAKAVKSLQPGGLVKQPVDDGAAFVVVKLVERWPAGTIPMQARRAELEDRVRLRKFDEAFAALPKTLVDAHAVELHPSFEPLFEAPK